MFDMFDMPTAYSVISILREVLKSMALDFGIR